MRWGRRGRGRNPHWVEWRLVRVLRVRRVTERLRRSLWLGRGVVKEATSGSTRADVAARRWGERVRVLASVNGRPVDVHGRERRVRGHKARLVKDDRWRGTTAERPGRVPVLQLRRNRQGKVRGTTASISWEQWAGVSLHYERRTAEAGRWHHGIRIGSGMYILRTRGGGQRLTSGLSVLEQRKALGDSGVRGVEFGGAGVGVDSIGDLVVAALVQAAQIKPHFRDVRVDANGAGVRVQCIPVLIDLEVKNADGAPERRIPTVPVHSLLVGFVRLVVFLARHVRPAKEVPTLRIAGV